MKKMWNQIGQQGLLLLMKFKFLIMMTRPQNVLFLSVALSSLSKILISLRTFCGLVIIIKKFNFINSRRSWPPNSIHIFFILAFFSSWLLLFLHQQWFGGDLLPALHMWLFTKINICIRSLLSMLFIHRDFNWFEITVCILVFGRGIYQTV